MTRPRHFRRWILGALGVGALTVAIVVGVRAATSGPLESADDDGYLGLRLLLSERGATVSEIDADEVGRDAADDFDVVFVLTPGGVDRTQLGEWHQYVAAGGRLVLGQPDTVRPTDADAPSPADVVPPGSCDLDDGLTLDPIHTGGARPHHVHSNERSCFGNGTAAIVTSAVCRRGEQITLATPTLFDNTTMGAPTDDRNRPEQRGNAELAVAVFAPDRNPRVGIVTEGDRPAFGNTTGGASNEPRCGDRLDDDALWQLPGTLGEPGDRGSGTLPGELPTGELPTRDAPSGGTPSGELPSDSGGSTPRSPDEGADGQGQPSDREGEGRPQSDGEADDGSDSPEAGTAKPPPSIFDFLSPGLKLALAQLLAVLAYYAWRRSRRDGVVVEDRAPVELRSSRLVEAVAALRRRGGETERAGAELRRHTRQQIATELGLAVDSSADEVADAIMTRVERQPSDERRAHLTELLDGRPPTSEPELVALGERLRDLRDRVRLTGVTSAPTSGDFT